MSDEKAPVVSVVICVRNGAATVARQFAALDRQVEHPPFEVVVVDNGSTDRTVDIFSQWRRSDPHAAVSIRLVSSGSRPGIPHARNVGSLAAHGRVLAFCDADDVVHPEWVGALGAAVDGEQLAGGRLLAVSSKGVPRPDMFGPGLMATRYLPHVGGANFAIARSTLLAVGGFDESLPRYGYEDVDLSWRVQEAGFPIIYVPDAIVQFTVSDSRDSFRKRLLLGYGRVLMASRFPAYADRDFALAATVKRFVGESRGAITESVKRRSPDRRRLGQAVAALGAVSGVLRYQVVGALPPRRLLLPPRLK